MQCPSCDAELPDDARFCIECGVTLDSASTGPTVLLRADAHATASCAACGASNPGHAIFCVRCGQRMGDPAPRPAPPRRAISGDIVQGPPSLPTFRPQPTSAFGQRSGWEAASAAILLIGIGLLFLGKLFWPGILIVIGVANFMRMAGSGRVTQGMRNTLWLFGLAFLFMVPRLFFPGILVLVGLNALMMAIMRSGRRWP
ncbi:MAG: zinc ribbon domain-containing protein [Chloroflexales bacterium]